jgi:FkbM family methyltransferase
MDDIEFIEIQGVSLPLARGKYSHLLERAIRSGGYEKEEASIVRKILLPDDVVLEIGSAIGFVSTMCAKIVTRGRVFAFEANPALSVYSFITYGKNRVCVRHENAVLAKGDGETDFFVHPDFWASSLIEKPDTTKVRVKTRNFKKVIDEIRPSCLVVDIEGGEGELIELSDFSSVREIVMELHPNVLGQERVDQLLKRLNDLGFTQTNLTIKNVAHFSRLGVSPAYT